MKKTKFIFISVIILAYLIFSGVIFYRHTINNKKIEQNIEMFFSQRGSIDSNLRNQIVLVQKKIVNLPKIFTSNKRSVILNKLSSIYSIENKEDISNRDLFAKIFSRSERKEIFTGKIIAQLDENKLYYAYAIIDENGEFSDSITRIQIKSENINNDFAKITTIINSDSIEENKLNYEEKISILKKICIDSAFEAEKTRIEFVANENDISKINNKFIKLNRENSEESFLFYLILSGCNTLFVLICALITIFRRTKAISKNKITNHANLESVILARTMQE